MQIAARQHARLRRAGFPFPLRRTFIVPLLLGGCSSSSHLTFLDPQGPIAVAQRTHLIDVVLLMMIVVLPVLVLTPFFAWRYRYRNAIDALHPDIGHFSWPLEIAIWGIPFGIVIVLGVWLWTGHAGRSTPMRRCPPTSRRCGSRSSATTGSGCSSTPTRASPASGNWLCPPTSRSRSSSPPTR